MTPLHHRKRFRSRNTGRRRAPSRPRSLTEKGRDIQRELSVVQQTLADRLLARDLRVDRVLSTIHEQLFDPSLTAASVGMSSPSARLRFQRFTGAGVRAYIENARLDASKRLLTIPDLEVYLIADAVGYDHYETYARAFKRRVRCSPSEFRARVSGHRGASGNVRAERHGEMSL